MLKILSSRRNLLLILIIGVLLSILSYFYSQYKAAKEQPNQDLDNISYKVQLIESKIVTTKTVESK